MKPEDLISNGDNWEQFENFQSEFRDIVTSENFRRFINIRQNYKSYRIHKNKLQSDFRIHQNKIGK